MLLTKQCSGSMPAYLITAINITKDMLQDVKESLDMVGVFLLQEFLHGAFVPITAPKFQRPN